MPDPKQFEKLISDLDKKVLRTLKYFRSFTCFNLSAREVQATTVLLNLRHCTNDNMLILQKQSLGGLLKSSCPEKFRNEYCKIFAAVSSLKIPQAVDLIFY